MTDIDIIDAKNALRRHIYDYSDGFEGPGEDRGAELTVLLNRLEVAFPGDMSYETPRLRALADVAFYFPGKPAGTAATDQLLDYLNEL